MATAKEIQGELRITTACPPFLGLLGSAVERFFSPKKVISVIRGDVRRVSDNTQNCSEGEAVKGAVVRVFGSDIVPILCAETDSEGKFILSSINTMGLDEQRQITLHVTDPVSAITQTQKVLVDLQADPFAKTYPEWNIVSAAVLKECFKLYKEDWIRVDDTPPTIEMILRAETLVDGVMEEDHDLEIKIHLNDNRTKNPILNELRINEDPPIYSLPEIDENTYQYVKSQIKSGNYCIQVKASDDAVDEKDLPKPNIGTIEKFIVVKKAGEPIGAVEGDPKVLTYELDYTDDRQTVDIDTHIQIVFNEPIAINIAENSADWKFFLFDVTDDPNGVSVEGDFVFTDYDSKLTFIPARKLMYGHSYEIRLDTITDIGFTVILNAARKLFFKKSFYRMAPVTEWLLRGIAAPAEKHVIPDRDIFI